MNNPSQSSSSDESPLAGATANELAKVRTELASERNAMAKVRTELARDRNRLAAERTLMAWIRTSLSMISFGFGIDRFFTYLKQSQTGTSVNQVTEERVLGLGLIVLGVVALAGGTLNYWRVLKNLEKPEFKYTYTSDRSFVITIAIVLLFIGLASYIPLITQDVSLEDIISLNSKVVNTLVSLSIFTIMLSIGASLSVPDLLAFWQQPTLLLRSILAIVVIPPLVLLGIFSVFNLPESFAVALILMIAAPGPALLSRRAAQAGACPNFTISLQITLALLAILVTPLILKFFAVFYFGSGLQVNALQVAQQVGIVQFLPLGIGVAIATIWKDTAAEIGEVISTIANTLFIILVLIIVIISLEIIPTLGITILAFTVFLTLLGLAIGHIAGIGLASKIQSGIAIATIARNTGLAIALAAFNGLEMVIPLIVGVLIIGIITGVPYSIWMKSKTSS